MLGCSSTAVFTGLTQCQILIRSKSESLRGKPRPGACGANHRDWKGGISGWRKLARKRLNAVFVRPVMERDKFVCQWCGDKKKLVVHHHLRSFMEIVQIVKLTVCEHDLENFVSAIVSEHRLADGITICKKCHDSHHKEHGK